MNVPEIGTSTILDKLQHMEFELSALHSLSDANPNISNLSNETPTQADDNDTVSSAADRWAEELRSISGQLAEGNSKFGSDIAFCTAEALNRTAKLIREGNIPKAREFSALNVFPLILHLWRDAYFWLKVYPEHKEMTSYREGQVNQLRSLRESLSKIMEEPYTYDVTIGITAYNKLDYSRLAIESIFDHTDFDKWRIELILIDNGSTDGTSAFFSSVKDAKCIHLSRPLGYPATTLGAYAAKGKYYIHFANDIVATPHWLENLMECICSGSDIAMAVPMCNAMSSRQSMRVSYQNPLEDRAGLYDFARGYNKKHSGQWEERVRLLPCMSIMPAPVAKAAYNDALFHFGEFADDDVSTRLRRAGFKQLFASGTFVHHFGSVTSGNAQRTRKSLTVSRALYMQKWSVDAWSSWDWELYIATWVMEKMPSEGKRILWIDPEFCEMPIMVRENRQKQGSPLSLSCAAVTDPLYLPDAEGVLDRSKLGSIEECLDFYGGEHFDIIAFRANIAGYLGHEGLSGLFVALKGILADGGHIIFTSLNSQVYMLVDHLCASSSPVLYGQNRVKPISFNPWDIVSAANKSGFSAQIIPCERQLDHTMDKVLRTSSPSSAINRNLFILTLDH